MKTPFFSMMAAVTLIAASPVVAQEGPMNSGLVQNLSKEQGTLTIRTEQSGGGPIVYHGMNKAEILTAGGKPATLADIAIGQRVSVFYLKQGEQWFVSRIVIPDPATATTATTSTTAPTNATGASATTNTSNAATDGDRTTRPGNSAATDGDRTTRPPNAAATDGDRTTVPADGPRRGLRRQ